MEQGKKLENNPNPIKFTLIGTHGYSGNAAATALAPASFVHDDSPTKNSLPVNSTSPPSNFAF